jgi:hypothetical protein
MKIQADGYRRSVVGSHTVIDKLVTDDAIAPTEAGIRVRLSPTRSLALSGNFYLTIDFSREELEQMVRASLVKGLTKRIADLEKVLSKLK